MITDQRLAEVLDYMRVDPEDTRAVGVIRDSIVYLTNAGIPCTDTDEYMSVLKPLALANYDGQPMLAVGQRAINQMELVNEVNCFGL